MSSANLPGILCALAHGANPNYANEDEDSRTPILHAIKMVKGGCLVVPFHFMIAMVIDMDM